MIEAIALIYYAVTVCGATNTLAYWLVTSLFAWILMGLFTRGRNEDLEELLRNGKEEEKVECCAPFQDPAALAAAQRPSVRRSPSTRPRSRRGSDAPTRPIARRGAAKRDEGGGGRVSKQEFNPILTVCTRNMTRSGRAVLPCLNLLLLQFFFRS